MKKIIQLVLLVFVSICSSAQVGSVNDDDDNDGVINVNDACPNTPGKKTNKGCPETKTEKPKTTKVAAPKTATTKAVVQKSTVVKKEFITQSNLNIIQGSICNGLIAKQIHPDAPKDITQVNMTLLPKNGKENNLPVFYSEIDGIGYTYILLSPNFNDMVSIENEVSKKLLSNEYNCFDVKKYKKTRGATKDTVYYQPASNDGTNLSIALYKLKVTETEQYVTLLFAKPVKQGVTNTPSQTPVKPSGTNSTDFNTTFCNQFNYLLSNRKSGFENLKDIDTEEKVEGAYDVASIEYDLIDFNEKNALLLYHKTEKKFRTLTFYSNVFASKELATQQYNKIAAVLKTCHPEIVFEEKQSKVNTELPALYFKEKQNHDQPIYYIIITKRNENYIVNLTFKFE